MRSLSRRTLAIVVMTTLTGCGISIDLPKQDANQVCPPVQVEVNWRGQISNFAATLDSAAVTSQFSVNYGNNQATAQLSAVPGTHTLVVQGDFTCLWGPCTVHATRTFAVPGISLSCSPTSMPLPKNSTASLTVTASACVPVNVSFSQFPSGVTANPLSFTINVASSNPGISGPGSASGSATIQTLPWATNGQYNISVIGTGAGQSASTAFTLDVGTPALTSVSPDIQAKGGTVTLVGSGFDPACSNNTVTLGGINITPTICSPAGTSLSIQIPSQAKYGHSNVTVTVGGLTSSAVSLTVARTPGSFVDAGVLGQISSGRVCSNGSVIVDVATLASNSYQATYSKGGSSIGPPLSFALNNSLASNSGGAGFSMCAAGLVVDASFPMLRFLNFNTGSTTIVSFSYQTTTGTTVMPQVLASPDGTIVLLLSALDNQSFHADFIDVDESSFGSRLAWTVCKSAPAAYINTSNEIELSCGTGPKTILQIP